jgi:hypothetical protein
MDDMEKIQRFISFTEAFVVSAELKKQLLSQINDKNIVSNYERIAKGLKVEDNYRLIYTAMPWVKNINGLKQEQEKDEKEDFQVPDYLVTVEDSQKNTFPVLVDVKSVKEKQSCEIMSKQIRTLQNYATANKLPLLIAIYWEKFGYWTHVSIKNFRHETKKYKINIGDAISNDLSHIFGDLTYFINTKFYRKSFFEKTENINVAFNKNYGEIKKVEISPNNKDYKEFTIIESAIIDAMLDMKPITVNEKDIITIQIEELKEIPHFIKLSNWVLRVLKITGFDCEYRLNGILITDITRKFIIEFMKFLKIQVSYLIPKDKNDTTEYFFNKAYKNTNVLENYYSC